MSYTAHTVQNLCKTISIIFSLYTVLQMNMMSSRNLVAMNVSPGSLNTSANVNKSPLASMQSPAVAGGMLAPNQ